MLCGSSKGYINIYCSFSVLLLPASCRSAGFQHRIEKTHRFCVFDKASFTPYADSRVARVYVFVWLSQPTSTDEVTYRLSTTENIFFKQHFSDLMALSELNCVNCLCSVLKGHRNHCQLNNDNNHNNNALHWALGYIITRTICQNAFAFCLASRNTCGVDSWMLETTSCSQSLLGHSGRVEYSRRFAYM